MAVSISLSITQNSQSVANNTSNVTVQVIAKWTSGSWNGYSKPGWVKIDGTKYDFTSSFNTGQTTSGSQTLFTKTVNISHNDDGTKSLSCSASYTSGVSSGTVTASASKTLTTIARKSTLSASGGTLGTAETLTITEKSSGFKHKLKYTCGSASGWILGGSDSYSTALSTSWTPPISLASQNTTGTSVTIQYTLYTYTSGGTLVGSNSYSYSFAIPSSVKPSCKITVSEATSYGAYVKGLSKLKVTVTPTTSYGSAIASYSTTANGATYTTASFTTGVLSSAGTLTIKATVKDKRGRTGTASVTINVADVSALTVSNGTLGTAQTVNITENSSTFIHKIAYSCGDKSGYILGGSSATSTTLSTSWTPPLSLATENTAGTSVSVKITLYTYTSGGTLVGSVSKTITCSIPESVKPSCSVAVSDSMGYASKYSGYVKGKSKFDVVVTPTLAYESEIASYNITANDSTYTTESFTTDVLKSSGILAIAATVTDERGRSGSANATATVLDYSAPNVSLLKVKRCNQDGSENENGAFVQVTFSGSVTALNNKNKAIYTLGYKKSTASKFTEVIFSEYGNIYSVENATYIFAADTGASYNVQLTITDDFESGVKTTVASTAYTLMHWLASGLGMAIGKVSEMTNFLDVAFQSLFRNHVGVGYKTAGADGKTGVFLHKDGLILIQRDSSQGYHPYIGFAHDDELEQSGQIRLDCNDRYMKFFNAQGYRFGNKVVIPNNKFFFAEDKDGTETNLIGLNDNNNLLIGYDLYSKALGNTVLYGNNVRINVNSGLYVNNEPRFTDGGWIYPALSSTFVAYDADTKPKYRKVDKTVEVTGAIKPASTITGSTTKYTIFTLPEGCRPSTTINTLCQGSGTAIWLLEVNTTGVVSFARYRNGSSYVDANTSTWLPFHVTFFVDSGSYDYTGNVAIYGASATHDGAGNVTIL